MHDVCRMKIFGIIMCATILGGQGCATTKNSQDSQTTRSTIKQTETREDVTTAIEGIADAVTGKDIRVKYCPVCGKRYSPRITHCSVDGALLKELEE